MLLIICECEISIYSVDWYPYGAPYVSNISLRHTVFASQMWPIGIPFAIDKYAFKFVFGL